MGRIVVHEFITLDGVIEAPTWTFEYPFDSRMGEALAGLMADSKAILLGRVTYEQFAPEWSSRTAADPAARFMNETPKYVISSTLEDTDWENSSVLGSYDAAAIGSLKERVDGDIYVNGSGTLVQELLADRLVDELRLFVFPLALGHGQRLFPDGGSTTQLELMDTESYGSGVVQLIFRLA